MSKENKVPTLDFASSVVSPNFKVGTLIKLVKDIINQPLMDVIDHIIVSCIFSNNGKVAHVTPGFKTDKKDRQNKSHYRRISVS